MLSATGTSKFQKVGKLSPILFWYTTGILFFGMVAYIATSLQKNACNNLIITTLFGNSDMSIRTCVSVYVVGSMISSATVGLMLSAAEVQWEVHKHSNTNERDFVTFEKSTERTVTTTEGLNLI